MKSRGVYYIPDTDKIILVTRCEYYCKETTPIPCSLVTWCDNKGNFPKTLIREDQFKLFIRIGDL